MVRLLASLSLLVVATACVEELASPGACPDFCPPTNIEIVDTVISGSIVLDSSYRGYLLPHRAKSLQLTSGAVVESFGVYRLMQFADEVYLDTTSTESGPVLSVDSFAVNLTVEAVSDSTTDFELFLYRLPASVDSTVTHADLQSFFVDSTELASASFEGAASDDTLSVVLPGDAFPTLEEDGEVAAMGISMLSAEPAFVSFQTTDNALNALWMTRFVQVDSADGQPAARADTTYFDFDTFVFPELPAAAPHALTVGGAPSSRSFLSVALPSVVADSSSVIRATLLLVPSEPVVGAPGDSIRIVAEALAADIGPKSPIIQIASDSIEAYSGLTTTGSSDTVRIDITHIVASWKADSTAVRGLMLRAVREGRTFGEFRFNSSTSAFGLPALHMTYVPPVLIGY